MDTVLKGSSKTPAQVNYARNIEGRKRERELRYRAKLTVNLWVMGA